MPKPLAWQGYLCHGRAQGNRVTFTRIAIPAYLGAHGPATSTMFDQWLTRGATPAGRLKRWFTDVGEDVVTVEVEGVTAVARAADIDEIATARPRQRVRLLPAFDQYLLAPGTKDEAVVPAGGRVAGTWEVGGRTASVALFAEAGPVSSVAREAQVARAGAALGRSLTVSIGTA